MANGETEFYGSINLIKASSVEVIVGSLNDGNNDSIQFIDGDWLSISESVGAPGLDVRINFTDIGNALCGCFQVYHIFLGVAQHDVQIEVWNFTSSSWHLIGTILFNETIGWECSGLGNTPQHFFSGGELWTRLYHDLSGHPAHEVKLEYVDLRLIYQEETPPDYSIIFLAIGLIFMLSIAFLYIRNK